MSLLQNIVAQVVQNAVSEQANQQPQSQAQSGIGGLLGGLMGGGQNTSSLGGLLGNVVAGQMGGQNTALSGLLGGLLGGKNSSPTDLGGVLGAVLGQNNSAAGVNKNTLLLALLPIVLNYIQKNGGLSGMLAKFSSNGLGNKVQSWVNIDTDNDGLDVKDILGLFGQDEIDAACQQTGANKEQVCQGIAELLPQVVNELTPQGNLQNEQQANAEIGELLSQLKKVM